MVVVGGSVVSVVVGSVVVELVVTTETVEVVEMAGSSIVVGASLMVVVVVVVVVSVVGSGVSGSGSSGSAGSKLGSRYLAGAVSAWTPSAVADSVSLSSEVESAGVGSCAVVFWLSSGFVTTVVVKEGDVSGRPVSVGPVALVWLSATDAGEVVSSPPQAATITNTPNQTIKK